MANDGVSAVRAAVNGRPDVVVLDISLPAGTVLRWPKGFRRIFPIPSASSFLTASKRSDFRQRAERLGAVAFFEKPYEAEALLSAVQRALG